MAKKNVKFTRQEKAFSVVMAAVGDPTYAAAKAAYSSPQQRGSENMQRPKIQAEVARLQNERLFNEALPLAVERHIALLQNPLTPGNVQVQAIKLAYDRTLGRDDAGTAKDPSEMNGDELQALIDRLKRQAADQARPVLEHVESEEDSPKAGAFD